MDITTGAVIIAGIKYVGPHAGKVVADFTAAVFMPTGQAIGQALAHPILEWQKRRAARAEAVIQEAAMQLHAAGLEPQPVPGRILMPLLEKASVEEDETLRTRWIRLLASAASRGNAIPPAFVSILGDLSPTEARFLELAHDHYLKNTRNEVYPHSLAGSLDVDKGEAFMAVDNIERLGLWRQTGTSVNVDDIAKSLAPSKDPVVLTLRKSAIMVQERTGVFVFTTLGLAFLEACLPHDRKTDTQTP
jgi:hypothetical protein